MAEEQIEAITSRHPRDYTEAIAKYKRLTAAGSPRAMGQLGYCIYKGIGTEKRDEPAGLALLERAAELDDLFSIYTLGCWYLTGQVYTGQDVRRGHELLCRIKGDRDPESHTYCYGLLKGFDRMFQTR